MRRGQALVLAAAAIAVGAVVGGQGAPPLYDSLGVAGPFRYVCLPEGVNPALHPPPQPATQTLPLRSGQSPPIEFTSGEQPIPIVQVLVGAGSLVIPTGATSVTVTAAPVVPPAMLPTDGVIDGNVYDITVTAGGVPAALAPGQPATVVLQGPPTGRAATVEQLVSGTWHRLDTQPVGTVDIFGANVSSFTTFALVLPGPPQTHAAAGCLPSSTLVTPGGSTAAAPGGSASYGDPGTGAGGAGTVVLVGVGVAALAVVVGLVVALRWLGASDDGPRSGGGPGAGSQPGAVPRRTPPSRGSGGRRGRRG